MPTLGQPDLQALRTASPELDRPRYTGGSTGAPQPVRITPRMLLAQLQTYAELLQTRGVLAAGSVAAAGGAEPAWTSLHLFLNFALHDLSLGACALLHPMGLTRPADSVCPVALHHIANRFGPAVLSASPAVWCRLTAALRTPRPALLHPPP